VLASDLLRTGRFQPVIEHPGGEQLFARARCGELLVRESGKRPYKSRAGQIVGDVPSELGTGVDAATADGASLAIWPARTIHGDPYRLEYREAARAEVPPSSRG
jgi:hypothetical protein